MTTTMRVQFRPYQSEAISRIVDAYKVGEEMLGIHLPTGTGKSIIQVAVPALVPDLYPAAIAVPSDVLVDNAVEALSLFFSPSDIGVVKAERNQYDRKVVVVSIQTAIKEHRLEPLRGRFRYVGVDEMHLFMAPQWRMAIEAMGNPRGCLRVGFTATIKRQDRQGLAPLFGRLAYTRTLWSMIAEGWLCNLKGLRIDAEVDFSKIPHGSGDYSDDELAKVLGTPDQIERLYEAWKQHAGDRLSMIFTASVKMAQDCADYWRANGETANWVSGKLDEQESKDRLVAYRAGEFQTMMNCAKLVVGFDHKPISCVMVARPTRSQTLYIQMCIDDQTEILSPTGWKRRGQFGVGDLVAGYDIASQEIRWVPVQEVTDRPLYTGEEMYTLQTSSLNFRITGQHDLVIRSRHGRKRNRSPWRKVTAEVTANIISECELPTSGFQEAPGVPLTDDELRFIGWFVTNGTMNKTTRQIIISQAEHQTSHHAAIRSCLDGCGFRYGVHTVIPNGKFKATSNNVRYTISYGAPLRKSDAHLRGWQTLEVYVDKDLAPALDDLTREQLLVLLEAIHLGDGAKQQNQSWTRQSYHISTGNLTFAERLQSLCIRRGLQCSVAKHLYNVKPLYIIHVKDKTVHNVHNRASDGRPGLIKCRTQPKEMVWCVSNELGTIITRREGKAVIMGNCGRGTRMCTPEFYADCTLPLAGKVLPRKDDCLILDVGGNNDKVGGLQQYPDIFDLPEGAVEQIKERMATEKVMVSFADPGGILEEMDPLYKARTAVAERIDLFNDSKLAWVKNRYAGWSLSVGDGMIMLDKVKTGGYTARFVEDVKTGKADPVKGTPIWERHETHLIDYPVSIDLAMGMAENEAAARIKNAGDPNKAARISDKDATWRGFALTEKQFDALVKRKKWANILMNSPNIQTYLAKCKQTGTVPMTAGDASDAITAIVANGSIYHQRNPNAKPPRRRRGTP